MTETKPFIKSTRIVAALVALILAVGQMFDLDLTPLQEHIALTLTAFYPMFNMYARTYHPDIKLKGFFFPEKKYKVYGGNAGESYQLFTIEDSLEQAKLAAEELKNDFFKITKDNPQETLIISNKV
jgi:hypothetical protein